MAHPHSTQKRTSRGKQTTIARKQVRAVKYGTTTNTTKRNTK